ncbi:MAG: FkbM family methyltransferase, partial [Elusimicrobiota bacterium]|nr:FkbM family methyltransferase [Elusimicrobiota bacterium]
MIKFLRNTLRFLAPDRSRKRDRIAMLDAKLDDALLASERIEAKIRILGKNNIDMQAKIKAATAAVSAQIDKLASALPKPPPKPSLRQVNDVRLLDLRNFEATWLGRFGRELGEIDMAQDYTKLVSGLDGASRLLLGRILNRIKYAVKNPAKASDMPMFPDEVAAVNNLLADFYPRIIELSPECFSYGHYLLPLRHFEVPVFRDKWTLPDVKYLDRIKGMDFIDAGAFIGDSALVLSEFTTGDVHSFEPVSENYSLMLKSIEMNGRRNIIPVNKGIGRDECRRAIKVAGSGSSAMLSDAPGREEAMELTSIDAYVHKNRLKIGLIKADVEGFEQDLLRGAEATIREQRPVLLISIYHTVSDL